VETMQRLLPLFQALYQTFINKADVLEKVSRYIF
jgi:hypothetical protein